MVGHRAGHPACPAEALRRRISERQRAVAGDVVSLQQAHLIRRQERRDGQKHAWHLQEERLAFRSGRN
jgi:predicted kinase